MNLSNVVILVLSLLAATPAFVTSENAGLEPLVVEDRQDGYIVKFKNTESFDAFNSQEVSTFSTGAEFSSQNLMVIKFSSEEEANKFAGRRDVAYVEASKCLLVEQQNLNRNRPFYS